MPSIVRYSLGRSARWLTLLSVVAVDVHTFARLMS
jgi:hypothetical protein